MDFILNESEEEEIGDGYISEVISFFQKNCHDPKESIILSYFQKNNLINSPDKLQNIIKAFIVVIFYQNSNKFKNLIIQIIKTYEKLYPISYISYTKFLNEQISSLAIQCQANSSHFNLHNLNSFFKPEKEFKYLDLFQNDSIDEFQQIICTNPKLFQQKFQILSLSRKLEKFQDAYLMDIAAYYGSLKIFKFLYLNKALFSDNINCFAVSGGNAEIIHICESISSNYEMCLNATIQFHKNDIYEWLILNKNVKPDIECLLLSILYHNMTIFLEVFDFLLEQNEGESIMNHIHQMIENTIYAFEPLMLQHIIDNVNINLEDKLHDEAILAIKISSIPCLEILLNSFNYSQIDNSVSILFYSSIRYSCIYSSELILNKYEKSIDFHYKNAQNQVSLHIAVILNDHNKIQLLLDSYIKNNFDINVKDNSSMTPFFYAIKDCNEEVVKMFLASKKVKGNDHDQICFIISLYSKY